MDHLARLKANLGRQLLQIRRLGLISDGVAIVGDGEFVSHRRARDDRLAPALADVGHQGAVHQQLADDLLGRIALAVGETLRVLLADQWFVAGGYQLGADQPLGLLGVAHRLAGLVLVDLDGLDHLGHEVLGQRLLGVAGFIDGDGGHIPGLGGLSLGSGRGSLRHGQGAEQDGSQQESYLLHCDSAFVSTRILFCQRRLRQRQNMARPRTHSSQASASQIPTSP